MYFRDCKTLSVFERKIPLTFSLESSDFTKTMQVPPVIKKTLKPLHHMTLYGRGKLIRLKKMYVVI
jgi:hypothetical protein